MEVTTWQVVAKSQFENIMLEITIREEVVGFLAPIQHAWRHKIRNLSMAK
jgi:hypothetical protein